MKLYSGISGIKQHRSTGFLRLRVIFLPFLVKYQFNRSDNRPAVDSGALPINFSNVSSDRNLSHQCHAGKQWSISKLQLFLKKGICFVIFSFFPKPVSWFSMAIRDAKIFVTDRVIPNFSKIKSFY